MEIIKNSTNLEINKLLINSDNIEGHTRQIECLLELDEKTIASGSDDGTIKVWDIKTQKELFTLKGHESAISSLVKLDEKTIASGSNDKTIKVWDIKTQKELFTLKSHEREITSLLKIDEKTIASGSYDRTIKVWDIKTQKELFTLKGHERAITNLVKIDEETIASGSGDGTIKVWDIKTQKELFTLKGHESVISSLVKLDEKTIASGSHDGTIKVWDIKTQKVLFTLKGHESVISSLVKLDEKTIASASYDNTIKVWDIKIQKELFTLKGHESVISSLVKLDENKIASGSYDRTIKVWDIKTQKELFTLKGHESAISSLVKLDEKTIASGSYDKTIKVWDIKTQKELFTLKGHEYWISSLVKLDEKTIASGSFDGTIKVWDIKTQKVLFTLKGHKSAISSLVKLDEKTIASGSRDKTIKVWDINTQKELFTLEGHETAISSLVKLDEKTIASGSFDGTIKVWDIKTQKELISIPIEHESIYFENNTLIVKNKTKLKFINIENLLNPIEIEDKTIVLKSLIENVFFEKNSLILSTLCGDLYFDEIVLDESNNQEIDDFTKNELHIKTLLLGDSGVGKTTLGYWLENENFNEDIHSTHGMRFFEYISPEEINVKLPNGKQSKHKFVLDIWDFGGQPEYQISHKQNFEKARIIILVIDLQRDDNSESYWINSIKEHRNKMIKDGLKIYVVGTKSKNKEKDEKRLEEIKKQIDKNINDKLEIECFISNVEKNHESCDLIKSIKNYFERNFKIERNMVLLNKAYRAYLEIKIHKKSSFYLEDNFINELKSDKNLDDEHISSALTSLIDLGSVEKLDKYYILKPYWKNLFATAILRYVQENDVVKSSISLNDILDYKYEVKFDKLFDLEIKNENISDENIYIKQFKPLSNDLKELFSKELIKNFIDDKICYFKNGMFVFPSRFLYKEGFEKNKYFELDSISLVSKKQVEETIGIVVTSIFYSPKYTILKHLNKGVKIKENSTGDLYLLEFIREDLINQKKNQENTQIKIYAKNDNKEKNKELISLLKLLLVNNLNSVYEKYQYLIKVDNKDVGSLSLTLNSQYQKDVLDELEASKLSEGKMSLEKETILNLDKRELEEIKSNHLKKKEELFKKIEKRISNKNDKKPKKNILHLSDLHFSTEVDIDNEIILLERDLEKFNNESEKEFEINGFDSID